MKTVTTVFMLLAFALLAVLPLPADIGENFEKAGIGLGGGFSVYYDFNRVLDDLDEYSYWNIQFSPSFEIFAADNLSLGIGPNFYFRTEKVGSDDIDRYMYYGLNGSMMYAFVSDPSAATGLVPAVGLDLGFTVYPGQKDVIGGITYDSQSLSVYVNLGPVLRFNWFVTDRFSPYLGVYPLISYRLIAKDYYGDPISGLEFKDRFYLELTARLGFTYWIPNKDASIL